MRREREDHREKNPWNGMVNVEVVVSPMEPFSMDEV